MQSTAFGRYSLLELVGSGGMGEVWKAHDSATNRVVAVKVLNRQFVNDEVFQQRFHREARAAAGLNDPHVVPIHGYGEVDGRLYVEMRLIEGRGLDETLHQGPMYPHRAVAVVEQVASALDAAHRIGLVHRDVKPSNILLAADDFAYLIDLGIARATSEAGLTQTGAAIGTWAYMAPERIRSNAVDIRSDVYALACVLYECLTGTRPFNGNTFEELASAHLWVPPPSPSKIVNTVPANFDAVIAVGMAKNLEERCSSARELAVAARSALDPNNQLTLPALSPISVRPRSAEIEEFAGTVIGDPLSGVLATGDSPRSFAWPPPDDPERAPYRGWQPFEPVDAGIFFGRDAQIVRAVEAVSQMREAKDKSWFVVLGPSGAGKSAFLRAGLIPRLQRDDDRFLVLPIVRPERDPLGGAAGLATAIHTLRQQLSLATPTLTEITVACVQDPPRVRELLVEAQQVASVTEPPTLILPLDQAEELLAADAGPQAQQFLGLIAELTKPSIGERLDLLVAATIRTDRFETLQTRPELVDTGMELFAELKPMPPERFREVILGPATAPSDVKRQLAVSAELVEQLLEDCRSGADTLPLLSLTLARLYDDFGASKVLTLAQYQQMGGLQRIVQSEIDAVLSRDPAQRSNQLAALRAAFIPWLATINPNNDQPLRRVARYEDLPESSHDLVDALVARRLLIKDVRDGDVVVEVALESLLRQWHELAGWLREERANLKAADDLERTCTTWESSGRDPAWLLTGSRLAEAETLVVTPGFSQRLAEIRDFVSSSSDAENTRRQEVEQQREHELRNARERQAAAEERQATAEAHAVTLRKRSRVLRVVLAGTALIAVVAVVMGVVTVFQRQTALRERNAAIATRLNAEAQSMLASTRPGGDIVAFQKLLAARTLAQPNDGPLVSAIAHHTDTRKIIDAGSQVLHMARSPDGSVLAVGGRDKSMRLYNADTGMQIGDPLTGHRGPVKSLAFSPDGALLASASSDETVRLWDANTGQAIGEPLTGHTDEVNSVAFSPDGYRLATGAADGTVRLWNVDTGEQIGQPLIGHTKGVWSVAFSPAGHQLASGSDDGTVRLWDPNNGQPVGAPLAGHNTFVYAVAFSPEGNRLASGSDDGAVRLWDPDTGQPAGAALTGHIDAVFGLAFSPDGRRLASASGDSTVRLWNADTGQAIGQPLNGHTHTVYAVAFSPDGLQVLSAGEDATVRIWDLTHLLIGHSDLVWDVAFSPNGGRLATASRDGTVRLWSTDTGQQIGTPLSGHTGEVCSVAFSSDGHRLASGGIDQTVRLWDADTGQPIGLPLSGHAAAVTDVAFSPDGRLLASASFDRTARIWNAETGREFMKLLNHRKLVDAIAFSPDGSLIATASADGKVRRWDAVTAEPFGKPIDQGDRVHTLEFSPDGRALAAAVSLDNVVKLWDPDTGEPIGAPFTGHTGSVYGLAFGPDGKRLATGARDNTARLWDVNTGQPIGDPFTGHSARVLGVAFNPDGHILATASEDATVRMWDVEATPKLLCDKLTANMSHRQWREQISPDIPYVTLCPDLPVPPD